MASTLPLVDSAHRRKILVVDDDETACSTLALELRLNGFCADFTQTGVDAVSRVAITAPDAVVLDLHLAADDLPGFVVLKCLRAGHPQLPIIVVTGWYLSDKHAAEARALGVADYLF